MRHCWTSRRPLVIRRPGHCAPLPLQYAPESLYILKVGVYIVHAWQQESMAMEANNTASSFILPCIQAVIQTCKVEFVSCTSFRKKIDVVIASTKLFTSFHKETTSFHGDKTKKKKQTCLLAFIEFFLECHLDLPCKVYFQLRATACTDRCELTSFQ